VNRSFCQRTLASDRHAGITLRKGCPKTVATKNKLLVEPLRQKAQTGQGSSKKKKRHGPVNSRTERQKERTVRRAVSVFEEDCRGQVCKATAGGARSKSGSAGKKSALLRNHPEAILLNSNIKKQRTKHARPKGNVGVGFTRGGSRKAYPDSISRTNRLGGVLCRRKKRKRGRFLS